MTCASCVGAIESHLKSLTGVTKVEVNLMSGQARVEHDPGVSWCIEIVSMDFLN